MSVLFFRSRSRIGSSVRGRGGRPRPQPISSFAVSPRPSARRNLQHAQAPYQPSCFNMCLCTRKAWIGGAGGGPCYCSPLNRRPTWLATSIQLSLCAARLPPFAAVTLTRVVVQGAFSECRSRVSEWLVLELECRGAWRQPRPDGRCASLECERERDGGGGGGPYRPLHWPSTTTATRP